MLTGGGWANQIRQSQGESAGSAAKISPYTSGVWDAAPQQVDMVLVIHPSAGPFRNIFQYGAQQLDPPDVQGVMTGGDDCAHCAHPFKRAGNGGDGCAYLIRRSPFRTEDIIHGRDNWLGQPLQEQADMRALAMGDMPNMPEGAQATV